MVLQSLWLVDDGLADLGGEGDVEKESRDGVTWEGRSSIKLSCGEGEGEGERGRGKSER